MFILGVGGCPVENRPWCQPMLRRHWVYFTDMITNLSWRFFKAKIFWIKNGKLDQKCAKKCRKKKVEPDSLGSLLDSTTFRISIAHRTGQPGCVLHNCPCGDFDLSNRLQGFCCCKSSGWWWRHSGLNNIIKRTLLSAEILIVLETPEICRTGGKRVDGLSLIPDEHH